MMTEETKPKAKAQPKPKKSEVVENKYFSARELRCKHSGKDGFDADFLELLTAIREECDFPFKISSAFRDKSHPAESKKTATGSHQLGKAVDVLCSGEKALKLISVAQKHGIKRIGVAQKGMSRFIHIDSCTEADGKSPAIWSY